MAPIRERIADLETEIAALYRGVQGASVHPGQSLSRPRAGPLTPMRATRSASFTPSFRKMPSSAADGCAPRRARTRSLSRRRHSAGIFARRLWKPGSGSTNCRKARQCSGHQESERLPWGGDGRHSLCGGRKEAVGKREHGDVPHGLRRRGPGNNHGGKLQLAFVYAADDTIRLYRNGKPYGKPYKPEIETAVGHLQTYGKDDAIVRFTAAMESNWTRPDCTMSRSARSRWRRPSRRARRATHPNNSRN